MSNELLTIIISGTSGILGYAFREWQNHSRPFISLLGFSGDNFLLNTEIELKEETKKKIESTFYITNLDLITNLKKVKETQDECIEIKNDAPKISQACDDIKKIIQNRESDLALFKSIRNLLSINNIDNYLLTLLLKGAIKLPEISDDEKTVFALTESTIYSEGCYVLSYIGDPTAFGMGFNKDNYFKNAFSPLADTFRTANRDNILILSECLIQEFQKELIAANMTLPDLESIVNENSKWESMLYIANLKRTPILIDNDAILYVKDRTNARYEEHCEIVIYKNNSEGEETRRRSNSPLIIPSGENVSFSFFTNKTQIEMERGKDFRNAFNQKQAEAKLVMTIRGVGLFKKKRYKTIKMKFSE